jgi:hypothetical protein
MVAPAAPTPTPRRVLPILLALVLIAVVAALLHRGWSFYRMSMEDRVEHPEFRVLRPSGIVGNGYGFVAGMLMIANLSYLVRRRLAKARLGSMRVWLDLHVFTGLLAAVLVAFHSAFQARTQIAIISTASLGVVVATGIIGRCLHMLAPATEGRLRAAIDAVERELPGSGAPLRAAIRELPAPRLPADASLVRALAAIPAWRALARRRRETIELLLPPPRRQPRALRAAAAELYAASASDARGSGLAALLRRWRGLHRFAALAMIAAVLFHAGVAWHYGYRWIF